MSKSKDIRSFFQVTKKKTAPPTEARPPESLVVKRKAIQISSDEEEIAGTPQEKVKPSKPRGKKARVIESEDEEDGAGASSKNGKKKPNLYKLNENGDLGAKGKKPVNVSNIFGAEPKRVERKKPPKRVAESEEILMKSDDEFEQSVMDLDETALVAEERAPAKEHQKPKISPVKQSPQKKPLVSPKKEENPSTSDESFRHTPKEKPSKKVNLDSSVLSDEDRHDRARLRAILYQKYKNRQGAINPGSKEVPKGKPKCLNGLNFIVSGVLESLERDEACSLITDLGGKVSKTVGKRLHFLVAGEEAGPKKLADAEELGIKIISEDQLFDLIRERSSDKASNASKSESTLKDTEKDCKSSNKRKASPERLLKTDFEPPKKLKVEKVVGHAEEKQKSKISPISKAGIDSPKRAKMTEVKGPQKISPDSKAVKAELISKEGVEAWVDKYKPKTTKQIIGQQGDNSNCAKLIKWLTSWYRNHDGKKKLQRPNPWAKNDDGSFYKAALLSGPPGIGKTTTATLVCKELGFDTVEFNASDTRSKKLLKEEVSELLSNQSLFGYFNGGNQAVTKKHVLIMDEVDGMAGNEDRGGIQELISLIKDSSVPIICMCNDRNHQKMRSLVNYCYDLRFNRPRLEQIKGAVMSICFKEGLKLPPAKFEEIIAATNNDIRQTLNHLSLLSAGKDLKLKEDDSNTAKKDLKLGPWDVVRKVFSAEDHKKMSINERSDLFFHDYSLGPLFVQQNYLSIAPHVPKTQIISQVALAADSLSLGDLVDKRIRSNSAWTLLPTQAMFSSVLPGEHMSGHFIGQINFPGWLGKNSKSTKRNRLAQEIHDHTRIRTSGSRLSIRMDYAPFLLDAIVNPLKKGVEGVEESLQVIKEYRLLREDIESLIELTSWPGRKNPMDAVDSKVKAALTRTYNKEVLAYSYSATAGVKRKRTEAEADLELLNEEDAAAVASDGEEDEKLEDDALIKAKKKPAAKATTSAASGSKAGNSKKGSTSSKGRGGKGRK